MKRQVGRRLVANQEPITREQLHEDLGTAPHDDTVRGAASMGAGAVVTQRISTVKTEFTFTMGKLGQARSRHAFRLHRDRASIFCINGNLSTVGYRLHLQVVIAFHNRFAILL